MGRKVGLVKKKVYVSLALIGFKGSIHDILSLLDDNNNQVRSNYILYKLINATVYFSGIVINVSKIAKVDNRLQRVERIVLERKTYQA